MPFNATGWRLRALAFLILSISDFALATTYFVATNGVDSNSGTSIASPFLTISKSASVVNPGDVVNIRGGTYRETVTFSRSGTLASPVTFQNYSNEIATVNGADIITNNSWTVYSNSIWRAAVSWTMGAGQDQVFVDGQAMNMARWPNSSLDLSHPVLATVGSVSIPDVSNAVVTLNDGNLIQPANFWMGARLNIGGGAVWVSQTFTITNSSPGSLVFYAGNAGNANYRPAAGNPYFLWGVLNALDTAGEWFLDTAAAKLYLWTPTSDSPSSHLVEVQHRAYTFDFNSRSNIIVRGLRIFGGTVNMSSSSRNNTIDSVQARYISQFTVNSSPFSTGNSTTGFLINGTSNRVQNSVIGWSAGNGIMLSGTGHVVSNCIIHDVDYAANNPGAIFANNGNLLIARNTLYNSGRSVLLAYTSGSKILYNNAFNAGLQMQDLGCLYTDGHDGGGTEIAYNTFHHSHPLDGGGSGACLYLDNNSRNYIAHHNVCYSASRAFMSNLPGTNELIYNNTLLGDNYSFRGSGTPPNGTGTQIKNNIFRNTTNTYFGTNATFANNLPSTIDPLFVNAAENNFQLQSSSPAIDAGAVLAPYTDGYVGAAPDIGAFEYGAMPWTAGSFLTIGGFYDVDIGGASPPGAIDVWDGPYMIQGGGADISGTADQFHFSYVPVTNNYFQIVARVTALQSPLGPLNSLMKCGVMMRETLTGASRHAATVITPGDGVNLFYRDDIGGSSGTSQVTGCTAPIWLKMVRNGDSFGSWYSMDGTNWSQVGVTQTITMSNLVYAGICLSSYTSGNVAEATVDNIGITPLPPRFTNVFLDANGNLVLNGAGGSGSPLSLLATTNLSQPLSNWSPVFTGTFAADGTFVFTNINPGNSPQFYSLESQ
ncbi:MAG TPA: right-handed parallel beta-helix repeat-containing protein [Verrucomicrobiae bacterium]|nr:right-handed parallel beta-helix repeat-containing protein [Verrucomicrobiae bacterium]